MLEPPAPPGPRIAHLLAVYPAVWWVVLGTFSCALHCHLVVGEPNFIPRVASVT